MRPLDLSYFEVMTSASCYQFTLYVSLRLAHRVFTLGELALVCFGGTALWMEMLNLTIARVSLSITCLDNVLIVRYAKIWPVTTSFIKTYRLPTPLLIYHLALIMGSFLTGFLLSPLLVLSRHIAQRPVRRLRFPQEKPRHRRALAAAFYAGSVIIIIGPVGVWTQLCLDSRNPWLWIVWWFLGGKTWWTRPALLVYWGVLCSISVAGWNRQLARSRRYRPMNPSVGVGSPEASTTSESVQEPSDHVQAGRPLSPTSANGGTSLSLTFPNLPNGANMSHVATDLLDAADKHVPTLSLHARRKFFHALAVVLFLPGVIVDVRSIATLLMFDTETLLFAARVHAHVLQRGICFVHFRRICPLLRAVSFRCRGSSIHERILGVKG